MDIKETYNRIATDWHKDHQNDDWWAEGTNKFLSFLKPGDSILDVGCGTGTKTKYLMKKGFKVSGIDISDKMIEIARREVPEASFQVMDLADVAKLENTFNAIFMQAVLLHVPKAEAPVRIKEISNKLKKDGYFYIAVKEKNSGGPDEEIVEEDDYGYPYQRFFSYYTLDEIKSYFSDAGLNPIYESISHSGKRGWIQVVAQKQ